MTIPNKYKRFNQNRRWLMKTLSKYKPPISMTFCGTNVKIYLCNTVLTLIVSCKKYCKLHCKICHPDENK